MGRPVDRENSIKKADTRLIAAMPRVAKYLADHGDKVDKTQLEFYAKLLPGALERHQASSVEKYELDPTIQDAINQLVAGFSTRNASNANPELASDTRNTSELAGDASESVSELDDRDGPENTRTQGVISSPRKSYEQTSDVTLQAVAAENSEASERVEGRARVRGFRARTAAPQRTADKRSITDDSQGPND